MSNLVSYAFVKVTHHLGKKDEFGNTKTTQQVISFTVDAQIAEEIYNLMQDKRDASPDAVHNYNIDDVDFNTKRLEKDSPEVQNILDMVEI